MTTIIGIKGKSFIVLGADTQITQGNLKLPFQYSKIQRVGSCLVGGSGTVGYLQRLLGIALRNIRINKVAVDDLNLFPDLDELAKNLADLNFSLPLEHKHFNSFDFLIGGLDEKERPALVSVGSDGSLIDIPTFSTIGSGGDYALSILSNRFTEDILMDDAIKLVFDCLAQSNKLDCFTNNQPEVVSLYLSKDSWLIQSYKLTETPAEQPEPEKQNGKQTSKKL